MKKFLITLISVILCAACAFGFTACGDDDTKNPDGSPKNMAETIIDFDADSSCLYCWSDEGNKSYSALSSGHSNNALGEGTDYNKYGSFSLFWKKGVNYKLTKLEFDITSQTAFTIIVNCSFSGRKEEGGTEVYCKLDNISIENGQTVHIVFDNLNIERPKYTQSVKLKDDGKTTDMSVLNWQIKISNLFITAEKV